jgi:hypothetical protein
MDSAKSRSCSKPTQVKEFDMADKTRAHKPLARLTERLYVLKHGIRGERGVARRSGTALLCLYERTERL